MRKDIILLTIKNLLKNPKFLLLVIALIFILTAHPVVAADDDPPDLPPGVPDPSPDPSPA